MWQALRTNDLQMVSTDHCPFCMKGQKNMGIGDFSKIPNGIGSVEQAWAKLEAGASALQLYSALIYNGFSLASAIAHGLDGEIGSCYVMTEPQGGADPTAFEMSAVQDGGDWVLNGTKHFISGADHADFIIVFIATGEDETPKGPKKRITAFLVDRGMPGFTIRDGYKSVSHRGYKNMVLEFDDCRLPDAQVLGEVDGGFAVMNEWLYATRITADGEVQVVPARVARAAARVVEREERADRVADRAESSDRVAEQGRHHSTALTLRARF